jgi:colanic acid/amylovoran biosynthesis glycosyltransferase
MKILFVVEHFPSFSETFVLNQVTGLLDLGHDVRIYAVGKPSGIVRHPDIEKYDLHKRTWKGQNIPASKRSRFLGALRNILAIFKKSGMATFRAFNPWFHGKKAINLGFFYSCLPLIKRDTRFDMVHCHFGDKGLLAVEWRKMRLIEGPVSTVFHAHELAGLTDQEGMKLYGPLFRSNTLLLPISNRWRRRLIKWGADPQRTKVHHMGVDLDKFSYKPRSVKPNSPIRIVTSGRLVEQKGYEYGIKAVAMLNEWIQENIDYMIIGAGDGAGDLGDALKRLVIDLKIDDIVKFAGAQPQDVVQHYLANSHIFLLPSVTARNGFQEGIPVALMEAMATGLPVISTRHSGIPELIEDGVSGFLVGEKEIEPLAQAMFRVIRDPRLFQLFGKEGRAKIENEFDVAVLNERLQKMFKQEFNLQK